jgi:ribosomal protein S6
MSKYVNVEHMGRREIAYSIWWGNQKEGDSLDKLEQTGR